MNGSRESEDITMAEETKPQAASSTARASQIGLEEFIEVAMRAALRAVESQGAGGRVSALSAQPPAAGAAAVRPGGRIITGIMYEPE